MKVLPLRALSSLLVVASCQTFSSAWTQTFDLDPKAVRFAESTPGSHSVEAVVVRNRTDQPLWFQTRIEPEGRAFDASLSTCAHPLPTGDECAVFVTFSPMEVGDYREQLCVRAAAAESCISLVGIARAERR
jgi:hypothetical protein